MTEIIYHDDNENNETSHELFLSKSINVAPEGVYGENLSSAMNKLVEDALDNFYATRDFLEDVSAKNVKFIKDKATSKDKSEVLLCETYIDEKGLPQERYIIDVLNNRPGEKVTDKRYKKLKYALEEIIECKSYGSTSYLTHLIDFFTDLKNSFLMIPSLVYIESIKRLQFTWVRRDGLRLIANVSNTSGLSVYISFRDISSDIEDAVIEVKNIDECKNLLKVFGFYAV